ncbi:MAG: UDP-N-acetylglucosamine--N-acetylmuramyl-(pentapeptide) pyrophosphoryl-undecaprenol N-acetylglucosamine transferase [Trueperaceae bacterium]|nr:UDP-N-acetylglucosamine--N-acetylmuramyl-(pentapeptide) pyrophosphoryl-undecaprenol N-acetylglucosamine transferase [Trueperaceae bacterium]
MNLLLAAGGTGGHVFPALALAGVAREAGDAVRLLGRAGGLEARLAAEAGVPFDGVAAGKWDRGRPDPREAIRAVAGLAGAVRAVRAFRPDVVVGFGGFASFPGCVAATLTGTPLVLHEGNAVPGRVTRWFARPAAAVAAVHPEAAAHLPPAAHVVPSGFPVREVRPDRGDARARLGLPQGGVVTLVMGGSQGSAALNALVPRVARTLDASDRGTVLHATGPRWEADVRAATADLGGYHVTGFVDAPDAWAAADLAITRAGVSTLSEAAFHGVPVLAVPLPTAADDHQRANARAVADAGAGAAVEETDDGALRAAWTHLLDADARASAAARQAARSPAGAARALHALAGSLARPPRDADTARDAG